MRYHAGADLVEGPFRKKEFEERVMAGLLSRLGFEGSQLTRSERPDVVVDLVRAGTRLQMACEIQCLYADRSDRGSQLVRFRSRWISIMEEVADRLHRGGSRSPYCVVDFVRGSYDCLGRAADARLVEELVTVARHLADQDVLHFPQPDLPVLSGLLDRVRVIDRDAEGIPWWPSHLQSGGLPTSDMDDAIVRAVDEKGRLAAAFEWHGAQHRWLVLIARASGVTDVVGKARSVRWAGQQDYPFTAVVVWDVFSEDVWTMWPTFGVLCDGAQERRHLELLPQDLQSFTTGESRYSTRIKPS